MAGTEVQTHGNNRLAQELSPYLQQHAHNPVDWYPWGGEALAKAQAEDKPILLSIGYSACHWCHVMEHESFDDPDIAELLNQHFVSIKVDREERPDLDQVYQLVIQLMGRHGGWPLTVFLTPDLKPFFAGTYFPPADKYGMPGFPTVLRSIAQAYRERRKEVERSGGELSQAIERIVAMRGEPRDIPGDVLERAVRRLEQMVDPQHGGLGSAPKFPSTMSLELFLRAWRRNQDEAALEYFDQALQGMADGGIHDQLGGGFHRYSVDERWLVPHFEKMLYDNALLARAYTEGWRATGHDRYAQIARDILEYTIREMRSPEGGFYSSQDADSEGEEGKFFVWDPAEVQEALGDEADSHVACLYWGIAEGGNFERGKTVLHVSRTVSAVARQVGLEERDVEQRLERARQRMFEHREQRTKPFRDEKIIATWNGLMIGAFAEVGGALGESRYLEIAREGLEFVRRTLWSEGRLSRIYKNGEARVSAFLEDYADVAGAALDVYEATMDDNALSFARTIVDAAGELFWDPEGGGFFFSAREVGDTPVRPKDSLDTSVPSGTSSMCNVLLRLHALTDESLLADRAETTMQGLVGTALESPFGFGHLLAAADRYVHGPTEVVVVGDPEDREAQALLAEARRQYLPGRILALVAPDTPKDASGAAARLEGQRQVDGRATAYVCQQRTCSAPVTEVAALRALLAGHGGA